MAIVGLAGFALLTLLLSTPARPAPLTQSQDKPIKIETDLVTIDAAVTDKDGNYIRDLNRDDFSIVEDGSPQKLDFFESGEHAALTRPIAVVFALDISGSMKPEELARQKEATLSFVRLAQPGSRFALVTFNFELRTVQDFTPDFHRISQSFKHIGQPGGSTRLFQGIDKAVSMLKRGPVYAGSRRLRRVVVVITDGFDSVDTVDQRELIRRANEANVTVYSITLPSYALGSGKRVTTLLDVARIVPKTGGMDFSADAQDFTPIFKSIAEEIRSGYTLAYYPPEGHRHDGRSHNVQVQVKRPGLIVRADRQSYVAPQ